MSTGELLALPIAHTSWYQYEILVWQIISKSDNSFQIETKSRNETINN